MEKVKISELIHVSGLKNSYSPQPLEDLISSIKSEGQKTRVVVSSKMEIIDGYRIVDALTQLEIDTVEIEMVETGDLIKERIARNTYRIKTAEDQVEEVRIILKSIPKSQGKKEEGISRAQKRVMALGHKWTDEDTISKIEFILDNDFENKVLSKAVVMKDQSVESCYEFLKKFKSIDEEKKYGFSEYVKMGTMSVKDVNKLIESRYLLDNEYKDTFVIPDVCSSYNVNCIELGSIEKHYKTCDLLLTSPPYFILRSYDDDNGQIGHEETPDEYCNRVADIIAKVVPTLKETANVIINIGETYNDGVGYGIPQSLKIAIQKKTGLIYKDQLVWSKSNPKPQNESIKRPINNVEYLLWFVVDKKKAKYNMLKYTLKDKKYKVSFGVKDVDSNGKIWDKKISLTKPYTKIFSHIKEQEILNVIEAKVGKNSDVYSIYKEGHPAIMSGVLPIVPILMTTDEGDTVIDCFSGSNVVGRMSILLNRRVLSAEISNQYYKIGCKMLENSVRDFNRSDLDEINAMAYGQSSEENEFSQAA
jgi:DNA modification methylase